MENYDTLTEKYNERIAKEEAEKEAQKELERQKEEEIQRERMEAARKKAEEQEKEKREEEERVNKIKEEIKAELREACPIFYENGYKKGIKENYIYLTQLQKESKYRDFIKTKAKYKDFKSSLSRYEYANIYDIYDSVAENLFYQGEKDGKAAFPSLIRNSNKFTEREKDAILAEQIFVDMSEAALLKSWGKPKDINTSVGSWGTHKQYVYGDGYYVYVENGKVTSYQY